MRDKSDRLAPLIVPTRRGPEQLVRILETLARVELTDGLPLPALIEEAASRLPRDATVIAILPPRLAGIGDRPGQPAAPRLCRDGDPQPVREWDFADAAGPFLAEGIEARHLKDEASVWRFAADWRCVSGGRWNDSSSGCSHFANSALACSHFANYNASECRSQEWNWMRVISKARLRRFWDQSDHEQAEGPLRAWYTHVSSKSVSWLSWADVKTDFATASIVGNCVVFNIGGNKFRLVTRVMYRSQKVFILKALSHAEYDENKWKEECGCFDPPPKRTIQRVSPDKGKMPTRKQG